MPEFDLIDRVARRMTEADVPGDFRVRVIAALPDRRPQPWWQLAMLTLGGVAAGMLVMVAASVWSHRATPSSPTHAASVNTPRGTTPVSSSSAPRLPLGISRGSQLGTMRDAGTSVGPTGSEFDAPPPFPFLSLAPIQPGQLSIAPIVVGPLVTGPLTLSPIEVRPGGRQK
jgi:hypothetical protein